MLGGRLLRMRLASVWLVGAIGLLSAACRGEPASSGDDSSADATEGGEVTDGGADICDEFTEVGAVCPRVSPVRCFALCDTGGCYCEATPQGPRWTCHTDTTCIPDCAPIDDGC
jgi:hypothetical protein